DEFLSLSYYLRTGVLVDTFSIYRPKSPWKIDGQMEPDVPPSDSHSLKLYAKQDADWLYLATTSFSGSDHFIYLTREPGAPVAANWKKSGTIAGWEFFLAKERDTAANGWYDIHEYPTSEEPGFWSAAQDGGLLEGAINLKAAFGAVPATVYVAVGAYDSADAGALLPSSQVPDPVSPDGNIDATEYFRLDLNQAWAGGTDWIVH
ncbi:MAG: hypothetical protein ABI579_09905, partial [Candidatus Sumerlaeota bacterium]